MSDKNDTTPELLPCPFCGSMNIGISCRLDEQASYKYYISECDNCGTTGPWGNESKEEAARCWNRRA